MNQIVKKGGKPALGGVNPFYAKIYQKMASLKSVEMTLEYFYQLQVVHLCECTCT